MCAEQESSRAQYCQWGDLFLANAARASESAGASQRQGRLEGENARLKALVGELRLSSKKGEVDPAIALTLGQSTTMSQPTQLFGRNDVSDPSRLGLTGVALSRVQRERIRPVSLRAFQARAAGAEDVVVARPEAV